jgi:hypothetical protein
MNNNYYFGTQSYISAQTALDLNIKVQSLQFFLYGIFTQNKNIT